MPKVRRKFSCGHRAFGSTCPVCRDIEAGILRYTEKDGKRVLQSVSRFEAAALKKKAEAEARSVKVDGKPVDTQEIETAMRGGSTRKKR